MSAFATQGGHNKAEKDAAIMQKTELSTIMINTNTVQYWT